MSLPYNKNLIPRAKELRHNMTAQEKHLWYDFLSKHPVRFQRQKTIGNYIVDFYCHNAKLVIEIDGSQHYEAEGLEYDAERTKFLESAGLTVIRFSNKDVDSSFAAVCDYVDRVIKEWRCDNIDVGKNRRN